MLILVQNETKKIKGLETSLETGVGSLPSALPSKEMYRGDCSHYSFATAHCILNLSPNIMLHSENENETCIYAFLKKKRECSLSLSHIHTPTYAQKKKIMYHVEQRQR